MFMQMSVSHKSMQCETESSYNKLLTEVQLVSQTKKVNFDSSIVCVRLCVRVCVQVLALLSMQAQALKRIRRRGDID